MLEEHNQEMEEHIILPNLIGKKKCGIFEWRNIIEGFICVAIVIVIVKIIPFVDRVAIILGVLWSCALFAICLRGIHDRSVSQFFIDYISFKKNRIIYHLRSVDEYENKQIKDELRQESNKFFRLIKKIKESYLNLTEEE